jgi:cupin fold WbuC family metalloprotein
MTTTSLKKLNDGCYLATEPVVTIHNNDVAFLHQASQSLPRQRARICTHRNDQASVQEMIISLQQDSYVHPHLHLNKTESFHIIEGCCDILLFQEDGTLTHVIRLGEYASGLPFFYRLADPIFHTLLIHSKTLTIHETTNGPFDKKETILAPWAPEESNTSAATAFLQELSQKSKDFLRRNHQ